MPPPGPPRRQTEGGPGGAGDDAPLQRTPLRPYGVASIAPHPSYPSPHNHPSLLLAISGPVGGIDPGASTGASFPAGAPHPTPPPRSILLPRLRLASSVLHRRGRETRAPNASVPAGCASPSPGGVEDAPRRRRQPAFPAASPRSSPLRFPPGQTLQEEPPPGAHPMAPGRSRTDAWRAHLSGLRAPAARENSGGGAPPSCRPPLPVRPPAACLVQSGPFPPGWVLGAAGGRGREGGSHGPTALTLPPPGAAPSGQPPSHQRRRACSYPSALPGRQGGKEDAELVQVVARDGAF
ncbi:basic proline-rich protein-like [Sphaerodactylus townsendi]|uniref:basic proline-rich protein-like n=1 Tax=Sphaerodactylus townsendi TaxID=933632 RepID=UPI0020269C7E|nr:basic proline-rich protein-like [Sphaerodactylus townsendi]